MSQRSLRWRFPLIAAVVAISLYYTVPPFDPDGQGPRQGKIKLGLDLQGGMHLVLRVDTSKLPEKAREDATARAMEIIRNRIDQFGVSEPSIQRQGTDRILVQLPGVSDRDRALSLIGKTALLEFKLVSEDDEKMKQALSGSVPEGHSLNVSEGDSDQLLLESTALLTGKAITDAGVSFESQFNEPVVTLEFNSEGAKIFSDVTGSHVGRRLAIVLDDKVQSAPVINERIPSGQAQITGRFTLAEANDLSIALRAGALPAPIVIEEERSVGATLGKDSVEQGIRAMLVSSLMVMLFVALYYLATGLVADVAMLVNVALIGACLAYFKATLTVPGIAGIILTIGMNVDTNVLILERVREELKLGKSPLTAVNAGYSKAFSAIFDGNLTALITGVILYNLGTGPIRGFAVTLIIGIVGSFFTGIFVTRAITDFCVGSGFFKRLPMLSVLPKTPNINFLKPRRLFFALSVLAVAGGLFLMATRMQPHLGIDFTGGILQEYRFQHPVSVEQVRESLKEIGLETAIIQQYGSDREIVIRAQETSQDSIRKAMSEKLSDNPHELLRIESVGPIVGQELRSKSLWAVVLSLLSVMAYLAYRFQFRYSVATIAAVFHDAVICMAAIILTGREISITVLAAVLTTIGYQVNDTIVTFDRVRENVRRSGKHDYGAIVNTSINETLSRTILTSLSVGLVVVSLYLFGGPVINDFAFTMLVGLIAGTYSTIFVACPMVVDWPGAKKK